MNNPVAVPPGRIKRLPRIRFIWGAKESLRANWFLGLIGIHTKGYPRELWIIFSVRGLLLWSTGSALALYFIGAGVVAYIFSRNPYNRISYTDLILPTRWSELRSLRGQALIDDGLDQLRKKQYAAAFMMLNHGLRLEPGNIPARLVVAEFFTAAGHLPRALQTYRAGLPHAADHRRFLENTFKLAEYTEDYELVLKLVEEAEAVMPADALANRRFLASKRIQANTKLGRHEANLALWAAAQPAPGMQLNTAWARALAATGRADEAIAAIRKHPDQFGLLREPWDLLLELGRAHNRPDVGREAVDALVALEPTRHRFYATRIAYLGEIQATAEAEQAIDDYFLRFGYDEAAVVTLLKAAEGKLSLPLLERVWRETQALGKAGAGAHMAYVQNLIWLGEIRRARQQFVRTQTILQQTSYPHGNWIEGTGLLLNTLETDGPSDRKLLQDFAAKNNLPPEAYRTMTRNLLTAGRQETAYAMAQLARSQFPGIRDLPAAALTAPVETVSAVAAADATAVLPATAAREEIIKLEAALNDSRWIDALAAIKTIEASALAKDIGEQLLYHRIRIHGHLSEQTELSWYMRRLLESGRIDVTRLRTLAVQLHAAGLKNSAETLLREVLRKYPDAKWASDLIRQWNTPQPAAAAH